MDKLVNSQNELCELFSFVAQEEINILSHTQLVIALLCASRQFLPRHILCVYAFTWRLFSILSLCFLYYFVLPLNVNKVVQQETRHIPSSSDQRDAVYLTQSKYYLDRAFVRALASRRCVFLPNYFGRLSHMTTLYRVVTVFFLLETDKCGMSGCTLCLLSLTSVGYQCVCPDNTDFIDGARKCNLRTSNSPPGND